jgi:hypothetical protein
MKQIMLLIFIPSTLTVWWASLIIILISLRCDTTEPPQSKATLKLQLEDVSCTEAWIKLTANNIKVPATVSLVKDGVVAQTISLWGGGDTTLYVDSLLPKRTYRFTALLQQPNYPQPTTNDLQVTTMDTTSHNFTWQSWTFGEHSSSTLYDVAIIDENNIWAVGEIYMRDSLGRPDPNAYNAVHWNGSEWKLKRIQFYTFCGQQGMGSYPAKSIFAFGPNDIWIGMYGSQVVRWNGQSQSLPICTPVSINKLWGSSSSDLYAVGNGGNIAHFDGVKWRKIESGTTLDVYDIWGDYNQKTGEWEILAVASKSPFERELLNIRGNSANKLPLSSNVSSLMTLWFLTNRRYYLAGDGIFQKSRLSDLKWKNNPLDITEYYSTKIRGNATNNIIVVGAFGDFVHFNGKTWKQIKELRFNGAFSAVDVKDKMAVCVGAKDRNAIITMLKQK